MENGNLIVLSGPSGVGKGTVLKRFLKEYRDVEYSVSATTRAKREGEIEGKDYFFLTEDRFFQMVEQDMFIEWAEVHNNYYGTPRNYVENILQEGKDIILEIDIQGARQVQKTYPEAIFVFLLPPSLKELEKRLDKRGTENDQNRAVRLENARKELKELRNYNYKVVNDKINEAVKKLKAIIIAEQCRIK
ncbi:MAG: guanylate kinase [Halanaerobiaceae bacterium]